MDTIIIIILIVLTITTITITTTTIAKIIIIITTILNEIYRLIWKFVYKISVTQHSVSLWREQSLHGLGYKALSRSHFWGPQVLGRQAFYR